MKLESVKMRSVDDSEITTHAQNLDTQGYTNIKGLLEKEEVADLLTLLEKDFEASKKMDYKGRPDRDHKDRMVYNLQYKNKRYVDLLEHSALQSLIKKKLNDPYYRFLPTETPNYILSYYNARTGGTKLDLHIDSYVPSPGDFTWAMQCVFVLEDHTADNGCTVVAPGSHLSGRYTDRSLTDLKEVLPQAGDVVLWDSRLWHGTRENTSGKSRWALIATLTQWWVKQSMDIPRGMPEKIYQELTDSQKALLGFCSIPPKNEEERINTKCGYDALKSSVKDYF